MKETTEPRRGDVESDFDLAIEEAIQLAQDHPGFEHTWLNAFSCIRPSDEFAADVGRMVIRKVMESKGRHVILSVHAS